MWARPGRTAFIGAIVLSVFITHNQSLASNTRLPEQLPEQFDSIKQALIDTVSESQRVGAASTYALLRDNLYAFQSLKARVDQTSEVDSMIDELAAELDRIATNFERAARLRVDYGKHTKNSNDLLQAKRGQTRAAISHLHTRIAGTAAELDTAQAMLSTAKNALERERNQIIVSANQSILNSLQAQVEIWQRFEQAQQRLVATLDISTEKVDFVLFVLQKNAQVYREAANTAQLRRNVRMALNDLQSLGAIDNSLTDLAASWREVDEIVNDIGRREFNYAGS